MISAKPAGGEKLNSAAESWPLDKPSSTTPLAFGKEYSDLANEGLEK
jgi:hypothetical protein